jgi:DNA replication protein DnaC
MAETTEIAEFSDRTIEVTCSITGKPFTVKQYRWGGMWCPNPDEWTHPDEQDRLIAEEKKAKLEMEDKARADLTNKWIEDNVPKALRETDPNHDSLDRESYRKAIDWRYKGRGLVLDGKIRKGKTRAMYQIAMRFAQRGIMPVIKTAEQMHRDLVTAIMKDQAEHEHKMAIYADCEILFIDDLGKEVVSKRTQSDFFEIVSQRCDMEKPMVITSNFTKSTLVNRYPDRVSAESMYERIRETCDSIKFR